MTKTILLGLTLFACSAWMMAQSTPSSSQSPSSTTSSAGQSSPDASQSGSMSNSSAGNGSETTIQGCLNSSGGSYTLTDASGTTYQLQGDTSKLSAHVNNEVELKGTASGSSSAGSTAGSSASTGSATGSSAGSQMFNVTKVKKVSSTCSTGAATK
ncbi:MAG TPA: hypothetical protein VGS05_06665 [Candidatus Sulfotelmatobacter sp.]|nr:hypothetical protein [Candidatus Sulfotelmatobacter sp.]